MRKGEKMARYIDTDDFINYIRTLSIWSKTYEVEALRAINELLNQIPTADVRENIKGEWKHTITYYPYCSECGWMPEEDEMLHTKDFCPHCGADMRGEK